MDRVRLKEVIIICFLSLLTCLTHPVLAQTSTTPQVDVEIGPEFKETDKEQINLCVIEHFKSKFPFDFVATAPENQGGASCPLLSIFDNEYEACFITDIYDRIEPAILISLFWTAIVNL